jgi:hypothetical protein
MVNAASSAGVGHQHLLSRRLGLAPTFEACRVVAVTIDCTLLAVIWETVTHDDMIDRPTKRFNTCLIAVFIGFPTGFAKCWMGGKNVPGLVPNWDAKVRPEWNRQRLGMTFFQSRAIRRCAGADDIKGWRRGWDSNPRYGCPYAAFRVRCFRPLSHLSALRCAPLELRRSSRGGALAAAPSLA